jgi:alpha-L-fucosidase
MRRTIMSDALRKPVPWEACITLNNHWGYCASDRHWKSADLVVRMLVECVSKNGNLLLNVGPDARGRILPASAEILEKAGRTAIPCPIPWIRSRKGMSLLLKPWEKCRAKRRRQSSMSKRPSFTTSYLKTPLTSLRPGFRASLDIW